MSISNNDFDPRFRPQTSGFDDAPDVVQRDARDRSAANAADILRAQSDPQTLVGRQALADSSVPSLLHIVEDQQPSVFEELGDHLSPTSNLSTQAKIDLMQGMLQEDERRKLERDDAIRAAYNTSRRSGTQHQGRGEGGVLLHLPVNKNPKKYGPKRTPQ